MKVTADNKSVNITVLEWEQTSRSYIKWSQIAASDTTAKYTITNLSPRTLYQLKIDNKTTSEYTSDKSGSINFSNRTAHRTQKIFELQQQTK